MKKISKLLIFLIAESVLLFLMFATQPWVYLPHKHIEIGLPVKPEDDADTYLIPMGEKIEHNASNGTPDGHPGLDFGGWNREVEIIAIADGRVTRVHKIKAGTITVEIQSGLYRAVYQELNAVAPGIRPLAKVAKSQVIGYTGYHRDDLGSKPPEFPSGQLHLDFGSASMAIDRLCPTNYFDADARRRIDAMWARVPPDDQFKSQYPEICNGIYKDKED